MFQKSSRGRKLSFSQKVFGMFGGCFGIIPGLLCFIYGNCCYPGEFHIKDSSGEKVGGFERAPGSMELQSPGVLHFEGMTSEQRRLALAAVMVMEGGRFAQRPKGGSGGGVGA